MAIKKYASFAELLMEVFALRKQVVFPASFGYTVHEPNNLGQCNNDPSCDMHQLNSRTTYKCISKPVTVVMEEMQVAV